MSADTGAPSSLAEQYLAALTFSPFGDIQRVQVEAWDALEALRAALGVPFPQKVARLTNQEGVSAWLSGGLRPLIDERKSRLFACDCAERSLHIFETQIQGDARPREALIVARDFANGRATRSCLGKALLQASKAYHWARTTDSEGKTPTRLVYRDYAHAAHAVVGATDQRTAIGVFLAALHSAIAVGVTKDEITFPLLVRDERRWQVGRLCAYVSGEAP